MLLTSCSDTYKAKAVSRKPSLPALTGLRWFAAMWVVLYHDFGRGLVGAESPLIGRVRECGYVAVGLFFMLSGFVLAYNYVSGDGRLKSTKAAFWKARFFRVYPVYLLAVLIALPAFLMAARKTGIDGSTIATVIANLAVLQAWSPDTALELNPPGWSLSAEAFFYLAFPFAAVLISRIPTRRLPWAMIALWACALIPAAITLWWAPSAKVVTAVRLNPLARCPEFLTGICLGLLYSRKAVLPGKWMAPVGVAGILIACAVSDRIPYLLMHNGILDPFFILLILGLTHLESAITRLLSSHWIVRFGEASYGLYILHCPIWWWTLQFNKVSLHADSKSAAFFLLYALGATGLSIISYQRFETPARRVA